MILRRKSDIPAVDPCRLMTLAVMIFLFSMVYFFCVTFIPIPESGQDNAKYIIGFLVGTGVGSIITFYFRKAEPGQTGESESAPTKPEKEK